jgi:putative peptide zinc metalloprotease protein
MYRNIEIFETDFFEKYLLSLGNKTLLVGIIVKDIVLLLKAGYGIDKIVSEVSKIHNTDISSEHIIKTKKTIDKFINEKKKSDLLKLFKLFNPNRIAIPKIKLNKSFKEFFYFIFVLTLGINTCFFFSFRSSADNNIYEELIIYSVIFAILFLHEIGHLISAKLFKINVDEIGVGLYTIFPVFYINLNESWRLKPFKRNIINISGILMQLIIGCFIICVLSISNNHSIFKISNSIFHINYVIILLNLNPFLKFDGYWILSDLLREKNLLKKSNEIVRQPFSNRPKTETPIVIFTILRVVFIIIFLLYVSKKLMNLFVNVFKQNNLSNSEIILILILLIYLSRYIILKLKNTKYGIKKRKRELHS